MLELLLPEAEEQQLRESPQERRLFRVECQVIWSRPLEGGSFAIGLRFVKLDGRQLKALSQLITEEHQA